jgi:glutathione S-transferase
MGSGKFAQLLPYADWLHFNNVQRGHQNFLEGLPAFFATLFGAGLTKPLLAARLGACYIVGRAVYRAGYSRSGSGGRALGAVISHIGDLGLLGVCIYSGWQMANPMPAIRGFLA